MAGPQFTLLLAVDDATGCVVNALFCEYENTRSYLLLLQAKERGLCTKCHREPSKPNKAYCEQCRKKIRE